VVKKWSYSSTSPDRKQLWKQTTNVELCNTIFMKSSLRGYSQLKTSVPLRGESRTLNTP